MLKRTFIFLLAFGLILGGSLAYFTDHVTATSTGTAGTVAIELNNLINLLDEDGYDLLGPGDVRDAAFEVINMGNKSIDVRTTVALTALDYTGAPINFTGDAETQSEFDLYLRSDVSEVPGEGYKPNQGAEPIQIKSISDNIITYEIEEYSLNGNGEKYDEIETVNGVGTFSHLYDYVLVFKGETGNDWQDSTITIDIVAEAKQHENTGAGWDIVAKETITHGSITKDVVVPENRITN